MTGEIDMEDNRQDYSSIGCGGRRRKYDDGARLYSRPSGCMMGETEEDKEENLKFS